ncbi:MAG: hypothetical protein IJ746_04415 [Ruminococcus sp.]|nr:hypothetical protein [Ruminococcus sp.]
MKRLNVNIEEVNIKGDIDQLSQAVIVIDKALQSIADNTDKLYSKLMNFQSTNLGKTYNNIVQTTAELRSELYYSSAEMNDLQRQLIDYQNKLYRYEGINRSAPSPNKFFVQKRKLSTSTNGFMFSRKDMQDLIAMIKSFVGSVESNLKNIVKAKDSASHFWKDRQYKDFSSFIDDVNNKTQRAIKKYEGFIADIDNKVKELSE